MRIAQASVLSTFVRLILVPVSCVGGVLLARSLLNSWLGPTPVFLLFPFAVMISASRGGLPAGLITTALSLVAGTGLIEAERAGSEQWPATDVLRITVFAVLGGGISVLTGRLQNQQLETERRVEHLRLLVEGAADLAIFSLDRYGHVQSWNSGAERLKGYTAAEAIGIHFSIFYPPEAVQEGYPEALLRRARDAGSAVDEGWRVRRDGSRFWAEVTITALLDAAGRLRGFSKVTRDDTKRHRYVTALERSEATTRALLESAAQAIIGVDSTGTIRIANVAVEQMFGYSREDLIGSQLETLLPEAIREQHRAHRGSYTSRPHPRPMGIGMDLTARRKDGTTFPVEVSLSSITDQDGTLSIAFISDISERKRAEDRLRSSEQHLRNVLDSLFVFVGVMTPDGTLVEVSRAPLDSAGVSRPAVLGRPLWDTFWWSYSAEAQERIRAAIDRARSGESSRFDIDQRTGDALITVDFICAPMHDDHGRITHLIASAVSVHERKRAEEALRQSEARARTLIDAAPALVWVCASDGAAVYLNHSWSAYTGMSEEESRGLGWISAVHPEDTARWLQAWEDARLHQSPLELECRYRRHDGLYRWHLSRALPARDSSGQGLLWFGMSADIEDHKRSEHRLARANFDLKQFAWAASHDLQEPLRMVVSFTQLLERHYRGQIDAEGARFIGYAVDGARRVEALLAGLRDYWNASETPTEPTTPVDLEHVLASVLSHLSTAIAESGAEISHNPLPVVVAEHTLMVQLFQNLLSNALKYRDRERTPAIHIAVSKFDVEWRFSVHDNGIGIPPEYLRQVFGIFKRLHGREAYPGTGIGLALCQTIVERHGGRIWAESTFGEGSIFSFTLPLPQAQARAGSAHRPTTQL
ncbi:MAG TPA: PAS domain S-box protein [Bryobacteraceae bacterium]|nr:PAS domain S-box protein [Bryobacteraceae bacterium]